MRRAFSCASIAIVVVGCKSSDGDKPTDMPRPEVPGLTAAGTTKPLLPADALVGRARIANLYLDKDRKSPAVEVWSRETMQHAATRLAGPIELGEASDWFGVPGSDRAVILPAGADPKQISSMLGRIPKLADGDQVTVAVFADRAGASIRSLWEARVDGKLEPLAAPPATGKALVTIVTLGIAPHEPTLASGVGTKFFLGTGRGDCAEQRVERPGLLGPLIGTATPAYVEVAPGKTTFTLHGWPSRVSCDSDPKLSFEVDVEADQRALVLLYTPDGTSLATLSLSLAADTRSAPVGSR